MPSASVALAESVVAPEGKMAFAAGAVKATVGAALIVTVFVLLWVLAPLLSVAMAYILAEPDAAM